MDRLSFKSAWIICVLIQLIQYNTVKCESECTELANMKSYPVVQMCHGGQISGRAIVLDTYGSNNLPVDSCSCSATITSNSSSEVTLNIIKYMGLGVPAATCFSSMAFSISNDNLLGRCSSIGGIMKVTNDSDLRITLSKSKNSDSRYCLHLILEPYDVDPVLNISCENNIPTTQVPSTLSSMTTITEGTTSSDDNLTTTTSAVKSTLAASTVGQQTNQTLSATSQMTNTSTMSTTITPETTTTSTPPTTSPKTQSVITTRAETSTAGTQTTTQSLDTDHTTTKAHEGTYTSSLTTDNNTFTTSHTMHPVTSDSVSSATGDATQITSTLPVTDKTDSASPVITTDTPTSSSQSETFTSQSATLSTTEMLQSTVTMVTSESTSAKPTSTTESPKSSSAETVQQETTKPSSITKMPQTSPESVTSESTTSTKIPKSSIPTQTTTSTTQTSKSTTATSQPLTTQTTVVSSQSTDAPSSTGSTNVNGTVIDDQTTTQGGETAKTSVDNHLDNLKIIIPVVVGVFLLILIFIAVRSKRKSKSLKQDKRLLHSNTNYDDGDFDGAVLEFHRPNGGYEDDKDVETGFYDFTDDGYAIRAVDNPLYNDNEAVKRESFPPTVRAFYDGNDVTEKVTSFCTKDLGVGEIGFGRDALNFDESRSLSVNSNLSNGTSTTSKTPTDVPVYAVVNKGQSGQYVPRYDV